jgi:hypothetical protein
MPWANLDDRFPTHPKVIGLTDGAFRLHVSGICYCAQYVTDGVIEAETVPLLMPRYRKQLLDELLRKGRWVPHPAGFEIHDYLDWNRSREQIEAERERKRKAGRKGAEKRWAS